MHLVMTPEKFDVLLMPNLYGTSCRTSAGPRRRPGRRRQREHGRHGGGVRAVHGTAPDIAGKNLANPTALLMSAIMMLRHIGEADRAGAVMRAMVAVLGEGRVRTRTSAARRRRRSSPTPSATTSSTPAARRPRRHSLRPMAKTRTTDDIMQAVLRGPRWSAWSSTATASTPPRCARGCTPTSTSCGRRSGTRSTGRCSTPVSDPAQGHAALRAHRDRPATRSGPPHPLRVEPPEPPRLPGGAAGPGRQRHPAAAHRRGHQPVRRAAGLIHKARHRRGAHPPRHQGPGLPDHAQGLHRGAVARPRPPLLPGGRRSYSAR